MWHVITAVVVLMVLVASGCAAGVSAAGGDSGGSGASGGPSAHLPKMEPAPAPPFEFNRYWENWGEIDDSFHDFTAQIKPQAVQVGFFGADYCSALNYAKAKNAPAAWYSLGGGPRDPQWWRDF